MRLNRYLTSLSCRLAIACWGLQAICASAATQVLYDANQVPVAGPAAQGWLTGAFFFMSETISPAGAELAPQAGAGNGAFGGYSNHVPAGALVNPVFPLLDRSSGYSLVLGFRVNDESHSNTDRAGFSVTLIGDDLMGIELGFQSARIFAQEAGPNFFSAAEDTSGNAVAPPSLTDFRLWKLSVSGNRYALSQGGALVLDGPLRNYSAYSGFGQQAYQTPNFIFLGDNTSSARASIGIDYAAITTAVPEPSQYAMLLAGMALVGVVFRRRLR